LCACLLYLEALIRILKQLITRCPWYSLVQQSNQSINQLHNISII